MRNTLAAAARTAGAAVEGVPDALAREAKSNTVPKFSAERYQRLIEAYYSQVCASLTVKTGKQLPGDVELAPKRS